MQLVLKPNERVVCHCVSLLSQASRHVAGRVRTSLLIELDVAQDGGGGVWPHAGCRLLDRKGLHLVFRYVDNAIVGCLGPALEDIERNGETLEAEQVIAIRGDLDLQLRRLILGPRGIVFGVVVELDSEVEAELLEGVGGVAVRRSWLALRSNVDVRSGWRGISHVSPRAWKSRYLSTLMVGMMDGHLTPSWNP